MKTLKMIWYSLITLLLKQDLSISFTNAEFKIVVNGKIKAYKKFNIPSTPKVISKKAPKAIATKKTK